ncbi:NmrA family NAD(P)-binding protein [Hymenobacter sp. GOD-10R]|uniref:NmrA family NAD(P)-binding protein n=1 Tax=Hymenobacter sp. GOD-10R TaxID=3093922 RepID=UPI002D76CF3C|nr:NmrA family NAD(P)-binding protein [Hymenobacter sp. GOD-10R]WRQ26234.1 NmrA family NAD(P)-binding protein [Hymenobacter sp. GOD-10R]
MQQTIVVAGGTGNLGGRLIKNLLAQGAAVRALVRAEADPAKVAQLTEQGAQLITVDMTDIAQLTQACQGAACVVSVLQGLRDVIVDTQTALLTAAVAAGVPRFIPSDFSSDFTKLPAGDNRNFDLRREFRARLDQAPIASTSVLNGAFADLLQYGVTLLDFKQKRVSYWEDANWRIDFTTMDDTAAFTAAAALDAHTPRFLRIASFQISPAELAAVAAAVHKTPFELVRLGGRDELASRIQQVRAAHPEGEQELYPAWQQMQYVLSMMGVQNEPLNNSRYPQLSWTSAHDLLS